MKAKNDLTAEEVRELLDYDPATGILTWRPRPLETFARLSRGKAWNTRFAGTPAGNGAPGGYIRLDMAGRTVYAHRLAWLHYYGTWPAEQIDHINQNPGDNRISNLREATDAENKRNGSRTGRRGSSVPYRGVYWHKATKKYQARITHTYKNYYLGLFDAAPEAARAYDRAAVQLHGEFATLNFPEERAQRELELRLGLGELQGKVAPTLRAVAGPRQLDRRDLRVGAWPPDTLAKVF